MPGIKNLADRDFIQAFQVMDRIIQNNQPVFIFVWIGSVLVLLATLAISIVKLDGSDLLILITATIIYLFGVQLPTVIFNIPLNNKIQIINFDTINEKSVKIVRQEFESRWNRWNLFRTILSSGVSVLLIILLIRF